jgi:hypothetical protein
VLCTRTDAVWGPHGILFIPIRLGVKATAEALTGGLQCPVKCKNVALCTIIAYSPTHSRSLTAALGHIWTGRVERQCQRELVIYHLPTEAPEDLAASAC